MDPKFVSVESPYNSVWPWYQVRNIQYAILCNTHAGSLGYVTWTPHICNTQYVKYGFNGYISDTLAGIFLKNFDKGTYHIGREKTLLMTNVIRQQKMDKIVCYTDYGISSGMRGAIEAANLENIPVEYQKLPSDLKREIIGESIPSTVLPLLETGFIALSVINFVKLLVRKVK